MPKAGAKVEPFKHTTKYWRDFFFIKQKHYGQSAWKTNSYGENKKRQGKGQEKRKRIYTLYILTNKYKGKKEIREKELTGEEIKTK